MWIDEKSVPTAKNVQTMQFEYKYTNKRNSLSETIILV